MIPRMKTLVAFFITTQLGLTVCGAMEFSLDEFLKLAQLAQTEVISGELKFIKKHDSLPHISKEEANAQAEAEILSMKERFMQLPVDVRIRPRRRRTYERNVQLARKYLPEMLSGEKHEHEEWNVAFEVVYFSAKSKEPIYAHRFTKKNIKEYVDPDAADFYNSNLTRTYVFDGQEAIISSEAPPNKIVSPEAPLGNPEKFVKEIRRLIGRCFDSSLRGQDIEIFAPVTGAQSVYELAFQIGKDKQNLKSVHIDVEKGFGVIRIEYFSPRDAAQPYLVFEFLEYKLSSGIWHPRKIKKVSYEMKGGTRRIFSTEEWSVTSAIFNVSFPDDYFQIPNKLRQFIQ